MFVPSKIKDLFGVDTQISINSVTGKPNVIFMPDVRF